MQRTGAGLRTVSARVAELERRAPEWRTWLRLLRELERALADPEWTAAAAPPAGQSALPPSAPLLHGRTLTLDASRATRFLRRLLATAATEPAEAAATLAGYRPGVKETLPLLEAVSRQDQPGISRLGAGADPAALASVAELALVPALHAAARALQSEVSVIWPHGHCPICAAWPLLAERRGLERARVLRCGRCAAEWRADWLCCVFCGERDHERLGMLVLEEARESRRVETCSRCGSYLKSIATLQRPGVLELLMLDLETVELDLAALDRGYGRPQGMGFPLAVRLAPRPRSLRRLFTDA